MRIETWDLKKGDKIFIHKLNNIPFFGRVMEKPFEDGKDLVIQWVATPKHGYAMFDEVDNHWYLVFQANLDYNIEWIRKGERI